jgi:hypothetical protein
VPEAGNQLPIEELALGAQSGVVELFLVGRLGLVEDEMEV